jgi:hypothetical protein
LLREIRDVGLLGAVVAFGSAEADGTIEWDNSGYRLEHCRLPGPIRSDDGNEFSPPAHERDVGDGLTLSVADAKVLDDEGIVENLGSGFHEQPKPVFSEARFVLITES